MTEEMWLSSASAYSLIAYVHSGAISRQDARKQLLFLFAYCQRYLPSKLDESVEAYVHRNDSHLISSSYRDSLPPARFRRRIVTKGDTSEITNSGDRIDDIMGRSLVLAVSNRDEYVRRLMHDIFGNPFRPIRLDPAWLAWNSGTVRKLAQTIYDERRFDDLPILADALEEAGCGEAAVLEHCRGPGPHVRGCWIVDLILGKE